MFTKGQKVVKVINVNGHKTATIQTIEKVTKKEIRLVDSSLTYHPETCREIDPAFVGHNISSEIVAFDEGEVEIWCLDVQTKEGGQS